MALGSLVELAKARAAAAPAEIDGRICGDSRQPVSGFLLVLELFLVLEGFNEGLLSQILGIRDISDDTVDLYENPPQVIGNKAILPLDQLQAGLGDFAHRARND